MKRACLLAGAAIISIITLSLPLGQTFAGSLDPYLKCANALNSEGLEDVYNFSVELSPASQPRIPFAATPGYTAISASHKGKPGFFVYTSDRAFFFDPGVKPRETVSSLVKEDDVCFKLTTPDRPNQPLYLELHASWDDPQQAYFNFLANEDAPVGFNAADMKAGPKLQHAINAARKCKSMKPATELLNDQTWGHLEKQLLGRFLAMMTRPAPKNPSKKLVGELEKSFADCKMIEDAAFRRTVQGAQKSVLEQLPQAQGQAAKKKPSSAGRAR